MVDIKPEFFPNTTSARSDHRLTLGAPSQPADPTVDSLTTSKNQRAADSVNTQISVKARILNAVSGFKSSIGALAGTDFKMTSSTPNIVSIGMGNPALASPFYANIVIRQLATPQIIVFRLTPSATPDTVLQHTAGSIKLATGQPSQSQQTLRIGPSNDTIKALIQSLNGISGLKASLLQTREGLALLVKTRPGSFHALLPASIKALRSLLHTTSQSGNQPLVVLTDEVAAKDTMGDLNGRPFVHASTAMNTLVSGYHITVHAPGQARLQSEETVVSLQKRVVTLLREINSLVTFLATAAQRGTTTSMADRVVAYVLLDRLRKIVSQPIHGFGPNPVLPADLGIRLDAAGLLTLNEDWFTHVAQRRRDMVAAIIGPAVGQNDAPLWQEADGPDLLAETVHKLIYDPAEKPVMATLNGTPLGTGRDASGRPVLTLRTQTQELSVVLTADGPISTDIPYGRSLLGQITDFATEVLDSGASLTQPDVQDAGAPQAVQPEAATADAMVAAMFARQIAQSDAAQANAVAALPPQAAEIVVYLLWIGLFIPDATRGRHKQRRTQTPRGWRRKDGDQR